MKIIQSNLLNQFANLTQGFTTKNSANLAFHVGDDKIKVIQNHKDLAKELGYGVESLVYMKQVHKTQVQVINDYHNFYTPPTCDALISDIMHVMQDI